VDGGAIGSCPLVDLSLNARVEGDKDGKIEQLLRVLSMNGTNEKPTPGIVAQMSTWAFISSHVARVFLLGLPVTQQGRRGGT